MASRFGSSTLYQRDPRNDLFKGYTGGAGPAGTGRAVSASPNRAAAGYGYDSNRYPGAAAAANGSAGGSLGLDGSARGGFRSATPNSRGQYSNAVLSELESQNDEQVNGILGKVKVLKDMTLAIGDEIRDSTALAEKMNDGFDQTRLRLRGTMNRMMVMAQKSGIGWRLWLGFFAAVILLFVYVWLF